MASRVDPSTPVPAAAAAAAAAAEHVCLQCAKRFPRACDLNKHAKSHTRPYKCEEPDCKYKTRGWPTAKELERHRNDKHSVNPRTFACIFQSCAYRSKRESNCKQHMEKVHGWEYKKSKTNGKRTAAQTKAGDGTPSANDRGTLAEGSHDASAEPAPSRSLPPRDWLLYDDDQADAIGEDDQFSQGDGDDPSTQSYLPWTSPNTRRRTNEAVIGNVSQTCSVAQEHRATPANPCDGDPGPVLSPPLPYGIQHYPQPGSRRPSAADLAIKVQSPGLTADAIALGKRKYEAADAPGFPGTWRTGAGQGAPSPSNAHGASRRGCPPSKKPRLDPVEPFTDTNMLCIFRHAHLDVYDRSRADRYRPCHTTHRNISTLIRHLKRQAHHLEATERFVSSFGVTDSDLEHPRAGVCRHCWEVFDHRPAFDAHVSQPCQKVSKGKREKWQVLLETFTPLRDAADTAFAGLGTARHPEEMSWSPRQPRHDTLHGVKALPASVPSATNFPTTGFGALHAGNSQFVPAVEHDRLWKEHQALRERNQQLERWHRAFLARQFHQGTRKAPVASTSSARPPAVAPSRDGRLGTLPGMPDQESLLFRHTNSQFTGVDVHVRKSMAEVDVNDLSSVRTASNMSTTSRSTIHHVPPSPPSRSADLPDPPATGDAAPAEQTAKHLLPHRLPLPSIPDSGYGTDQRRGSLGDTSIITIAGAGAGPPLDAVMLPPRPATAGAADVASTKTADAISWGSGDPFQWHPLPAATPSPPRAGQPPYSTDQYMAENGYDLNNEFPYGMPSPRGLSPGFSLEFPSLPEEEARGGIDGGGF